MRNEEIRLISNHIMCIQREMWGLKGRAMKFQPTQYITVTYSDWDSLKNFMDRKSFLKLIIRNNMKKLEELQKCLVKKN